MVLLFLLFHNNVNVSSVHVYVRVAQISQTGSDCRPRSCILFRSTLHAIEPDFLCKVLEVKKCQPLSILQVLMCEHQAMAT